MNKYDVLREVMEEVRKETGILGMGKPSDLDGFLLSFLSG